MLTFLVLGADVDDADADADADVAGAARRAVEKSVRRLCP